MKYEVFVTGLDGVDRSNAIFTNKTKALENASHLLSLKQSIGIIIRKRD
tara:strand:- start:243 stop:389 length:147 start_codon:yes stop_codon:yes gene_type:complete